jgi:biotin-dependent carboxylase-like uncharacterized protein
MSATLRMYSGGVLSTVQDLGRSMARRYGVPLSGAMDRFALEVTNRLVANPPDAAAIEITGGNALFEFLAPTPFALTGADLGATLDGEPLDLWVAVLAHAGAQLQLPGRRVSWGARAYLSLAGGIDLPELLGSRSTYLPGGFGGLQGRALRAGDLIATGDSTNDPYRLLGQRWPEAARPAYRVQPALRFLPGPHIDCFAADALTSLLAQPFRVSNNSNRMGYRLEGASLRYAQPCSLPSLGVLPGVIQIPPDGAPILLMADAQTTGGYPIIGVVIEPDLPLAAQLLPGDTLTFTLTTREDAVAARRTFTTWRTAMPEEDETIQIAALAGALAMDLIRR